jgi:hypothetical protein
MELLECWPPMTSRMINDQPESYVETNPGILKIAYHLDP